MHAQDRRGKQYRSPSSAAGIARSPPPPTPLFFAVDEKSALSY
jgi:hypothetical protein